MMANEHREFSIASELYDLERYSEAFERFLALARSGDTASMTRVAAMYGAGIGTAYDLHQSISWDEKAAQLGDTTALFNLGVTYRNSGNYRSAKHWFEKALDAGDTEAAFELAKMFSISNLESDRVRRYLHIALESTTICDMTREEAMKLLEELDKPRVNDDQR